MPVKKGVRLWDSTATSEYYPDSLEAKQLMLVYLDFVYNVIDEEFPNMERMKYLPRRNHSARF